jgi:hypothetical protein
MFETEVKERETFQAAYNRFLARYLQLAGPGACMEWFDEAVKPLLKLAVPAAAPEPFNLHGPPGPTRLNPRKILLTRDAWLDFYSPQVAS